VLTGPKLIGSTLMSTEDVTSITVEWLLKKGIPKVTVATRA